LPSELRRQILVRPLQQQCAAGWRWFCLRLWLTIPFLAIPAVWPLHSLGLRPTDDTGAHRARLVFLDNLVRRGVLYPRWIPQMASGPGYPLLNYYPPAMYYLVEPRHVLGLGLPLALMITFAGKGIPWD
jgi:hypothetical protein